MVLAGKKKLTKSNFEKVIVSSIGKGSWKARKDEDFEYTDCKILVGFLKYFGKIHGKIFYSNEYKENVHMAGNFLFRDLI